MIGGEKVERFELRLNNFLFNSGIVGFIRILEKTGKKNLIKKEINRVIIKTEALNTFEDDYFNAMISEFEKDTRWYRLINIKSIIEDLNLEEKQDLERFKETFKKVKDAIESASYKAAYEIIRSEKAEEDPYEYLKQIKTIKDITQQREILIKIIEILERNKETYCFKDIVYNKINVFWENVAFLNRNSNKNNMKEEYKKTFVTPAINYLQTEAKSDYNCIECGNKVSKSDAQSLSWIKDTGVDINRKKSEFWNFNEDAFICPMCALIYSCIPMGFVLIKSNGIFINNNESIQILMMQNDSIRRDIKLDEDNIADIYQNIFYNMITKSHKIANEKTARNEPNNIQVIKRIAEDKDNAKYKFNTISKNKLRDFESAQKYFERILKIKVKFQKTWINVYDEVLNNFLENKKQYSLINLLINNAINNSERTSYITNILQIQLYSIGGKKVKDIQKEINQMQYAGKELKSLMEENKLKTYVFNLNNAIRVNNVSLFMEIVTRTYCGLGKDIPCSYVFLSMLSDNEKFKLLGYAYILGLKQGNKKETEDDKNIENKN